MGSCEPWRKFTFTAANKVCAHPRERVSQRYDRRHGAQCCCYAMLTMKMACQAVAAGEGWSLWSDSHRRIRVYETRPVAAQAQRQNGVRGRSCTRVLHLRTVAL